ncbi:DUF2516 family protein [Arthrobacter sp. EH-1B-1]|uniref:DUF2516 family protein n=1 Tax=Arthrobacter vasquezii TaxID=2977629 RepID=A0ABT6CTT1_9MICC|nr:MULTISPECIES: DUF2516 family protein [Arthrobacter]KRF09392.1 hypothetical protein ASH00_07175 [Arthrobacter sp. Soil782]MDF9277472.1 DUF2516 family protein [Arthrobacter vasquezii]
MEIVLLTELWLFRVLGYLALAIELWALVDCARRKPASFEATFKRTKSFWLGLTAGSAAIGALTAYFGGFGLFGLLQLVAIIAACVYLADVKPAVSEVQGSGPYGPW